MVSTASNSHNTHSSRPLSRASGSALQRPQSAASFRRPQSSLSVNRPGSSLSIRRPLSRQAHRPQQSRSRLLPLCQTLVSQLSDVSSDDPYHATLCDDVFRSLESTFQTKVVSTVDMTTAERQIRGHAKKARIHSQDVLSEALDTFYARLKTIVAGGNDLDDTIQRSHIPDHLQFILALSQPPVPSTISYARNLLHELRNPPSLPTPLTWKDILEDERRMNEEEASSLDDGEASDASASLSNGSLASLSPWTSDEEEEEEDDSFLLRGHRFTHDIPKKLEPAISSLGTDPIVSYAHREAVEELRDKQYWRTQGRLCAQSNTRFNLGDPSTLGRALQGTVEAGLSVDLQAERYICEEDAVREVLIALQGRSSILFEICEDAYSVKMDAPTLRHLSLASQRSILGSFSHTMTAAKRLRSFVHAQLWAPQSSRQGVLPLTVQAFADAVEAELTLFDQWCSQQEEAICRALNAPPGGQPGLVVSLLSTHKILMDSFSGIFESLLLLVPPEDRTISPSMMATSLLDNLNDALDMEAEKCTEPTPLLRCLMRVFITSVEPVWKMIGRWVSRGMEFDTADGRLEEEFFIECSGFELGSGSAMAILDPDFWAEGYKVRESSGHEGESRIIPRFLEPVADSVLAAGKAVGLPYALDPAYLGLSEEWPSFRSLLLAAVPKTEADQAASSSTEINAASLPVAIDSVSQLVVDFLRPRCSTLAAQLSQTLMDDCDLEYHLSAIEGIYLTRRGDVTDFIDVMFSKMDSSRFWADFHFLNTAFSDVISQRTQASRNRWIQPASVRLSYRPTTKDKEKQVHRTVKSIAGLTADYAVPFPLSYLFPPAALQGYNEIWVLLLQIRRAKYVLDKIVVRNSWSNQRQRQELKVLYALRSRLSWVVNTLLDFFSAYVIRVEVDKFHSKFREAKSLDEMIALHEEHLEKVRGRCFLNPNMSALHRGILTLLDLALRFKELFAAFSEDNGYDASRQSIVLRPHRSRRRRESRRNTMNAMHSFSGDAHSGSSEDSDEDIDIEQISEEISRSNVDNSLWSDGPVRVEKVSKELDSVVRFLRRGVESLSDSRSESGSVFSVLAMRLWEWDL